MFNLDLAAWASIAEIAAAISIIIGMIFGFFQLRYFRVQRRDTIACDLTQTFYNKDLAQAVALIQSLPDGVSLEEMKQLGQHYVDAAITVTTSFETMGLLVFKRVASLSFVLDLAGGMVTTMSRKLKRWQEDVRVEQEQPSWGEWFDWLGEQAAREKSRSQPAHIAHRNWRR